MFFFVRFVWKTTNQEGLVTSGARDAERRAGIVVRVQAVFDFAGSGILKHLHFGERSITFLVPIFSEVYFQEFHC